MAQPGTKLVLAIVARVNDYQADLLHGLRSVFAEHDLPLVVHVDDPLINRLPPSLIRLLRHERIGGVVTSAATGATQERQLIELTRSLDIPRVHIGQDVEDSTCVHADNVTGMRDLMAHLLDDCGVTRPVLVRGNSHQSDSIAREGVFLDELAKRNLPLDEELVLDGRFDRDITYQAMHRLLERRQDMDAVVAFNDPSALGAMAALREGGFRIPSDVAVTGFDNAEAARVAWPGLTTIDQDAEGQGATAARLLIEQMADRRQHPPVVIPSHLIVRGSTATRTSTEAQEPAAAAALAHAAQVQLAAGEAALAAGRALARCRSTREIVSALSSRLDGLGIDRCFLAVYEHPGNGDTELNGSERARVVLDYRYGRNQPPPPESFPTDLLLPDALRPELDAGVLVLQPLSTSDHDFGYVLFELARGQSAAADVMQLDLIHAFEVVTARETLDRQNGRLRRLVLHNQQLERQLELRAQVAEGSSGA